MVYLDNAATTKPTFRACDWDGYWMNSNTSYANKEKEMLDQARDRIKECLGVKSGKVLFCRSATEAVEWLCSHKHFHMKYCGKYEHDSVYEPCVTVEPELVNQFDTIDLYLHQYTNNITGEVFDIKTIEERVHMYDKGYSFFGSDLTATIGHTTIPKHLDSFCDAVWFSGHKFHMEQGIGAIWLSDRLFDFFVGKKDSRNNYGLIHGTINTSAAIAMSWAMAHAVEWYNTIGQDHFPILASYLYREFERNNINYVMVPNDTSKKYCYAINAITLPNINADALQNYLASRRIYIGIGHSACADEANYRVLRAYGLSQAQCEDTIRISFSEDTTTADIDQFVQAIKEYKETYL